MKLQNIISVNPARNYEVIGQIPITPHTQIDAIVSKAHKAFKIWSKVTLKERLALLEEVYKAFFKRKNDIRLLASKEMGMPITVSDEVDIGFGLHYLRGYLDNAEKWLSPEIAFENEKEIHYLFFEPKGVAGISIPWNFPFCNFIWQVMQHLIVGNTVVFKHSEECPLTGKLLEEIVLSVNLPEGVFNEVYGDGSDVGEYLMNSHIDLMHFTGSTGVGKHLYQIAAKKFIPAILELGGSAPGIVFDDADLDTAIESIYFNRYANCGQTCDGLKRLIVHRKLFDEVIERLKKYIATKKMGDPQDPKTDLGPLVAERQLATIEQQVADAVEHGAKIVLGGKRPSGLLGAYYEPTILTHITFDMRVWKEEVFGPVLPVVPFDTDDEAVALANDTQYGLGGYIYTQSRERAFSISSRLETGNIGVNNAYYMEAQDPFGGYKNSGLGREHGRQGFRELCSSKLIAFKK